MAEDRPQSESVEDQAEPSRDRCAGYESGEHKFVCVGCGKSPHAG